MPDDIEAEWGSWVDRIPRDTLRKLVLQLISELSNLLDLEPREVLMYYIP